MASPPPRKKLVVEVHGFRRYRPGSGPPLQPITLLPRRDSTAYIVAKVVLPQGPEALAATTRRLMHYLIGWTDMPAARATIAATKILDYVSPAELEAWEYRTLLEREEEKLEAEKEAVAQEKLGVDARPKGRVGRPPKMRTPAIVSATPELTAAEEALIAHKNASGPSLSTPKKRPWQGLTDVPPQLEETDASASEALRGEESTGEANEESDANMLDDLFVTPGKNQASPIRPRLMTETTGSSSASPAPAVVPVKVHPALPKPRAKTMFPTAKSRPVQTFSSASKRKAESSASQPSTMPPHKSVAHTETYIPPPVMHPSFQSSQLPVAHKLNNGKVHTTAKPQINNKTSNTPIPLPPIPHPLFNGFGQPPKLQTQQKSTPVQKSAPKPTGFTPIAYSPQVRSSVESPAQSPSQSTPKVKAKTPQAPKTKEKKVPKTEEQAWEVKAVLDDRYVYDAANKLIHEYQVLWVGDWPPDQNPTWEPEPNLSRTLVKKYHKTKDAQVKNAQGKKQRTLLSYLPPKRFSNVAEAFAGELDDVDAAQEPSAHEPESEEEGAKMEEDEEKFIVTEGAKWSGGSRGGVTPSKPDMLSGSSSRSVF